MLHNPYISYILCSLCFKHHSAYSYSFNICIYKCDALLLRTHCTSCYKVLQLSATLNLNEVLCISMQNSLIYMSVSCARHNSSYILKYFNIFCVCLWTFWQRAFFVRWAHAKRQTHNFKHITCSMLHGVERWELTCKSYDAVILYKTNEEIFSFIILNVHMYVCIWNI